MALHRPKEFREYRRYAVIPSVEVAVLEGHGASFDIPKLAQSQAECFYAASSSRLRKGRDETDPRERPPLLRLGGERRGEEPTSQGAEECPPCSHWIRSSAA